MSFMKINNQNDDRILEYCTATFATMVQQYYMEQIMELREEQTYYVINHATLLIA